MSFDHYIGFETYIPNYLPKQQKQYSDNSVINNTLSSLMIYRSVSRRVSFIEFWKTRFIFRHAPVKKFISKEYIYYKYRL